MPVTRLMRFFPVCVLAALSGLLLGAQDRPAAKAPGGGPGKGTAVPPIVAISAAVPGPEGGSRLVGVVLWSAKVDGSTVWYRAGEARVADGETATPKLEDGEPAWQPQAQLEKRADPESKAAAGTFKKAVAGAKSVADAKKGLEGEFPQLPRNLPWEVLEESDGVSAWLLSAAAIDGGKYAKKKFAFDSVEQLKRLLVPEKLLPRSGATGDDTAVRFTGVVEPILRPFAPAGGTGAALLKCEGKPFERLLVRWEKPASGGEPATRRVLWLPHNSVGHEDGAKKDWTVGTHLKAFGVGKVSELPNSEYEAVRATALFPDEPDAPEKLDSKNFTGFLKDAGGRIALRSALELATARPGSHCWKIGNRYEEMFVTGTAKAMAAGAERAFGAKQHRFGETVGSPFGDLASGDEVLSVADGEFYPKELRATPRAGVEVVWKLVAPKDRPPFYLMDREFTVRQLVAVMLHRSDEPTEDPSKPGWWRTRVGRTKRLSERIQQWEKVPETGGITGNSVSAGAGGAKEAPKQPSPNERGWADLHRLTDRIGTVFAVQGGPWESFAAAWLFDAVLASADPKVEDVTSATVSRRWLRQQEFSSLASAFEQRAFAWAETGFAANPRVPSAARVRVIKPDETEQEKKHREEREKYEAEQEAKWQAGFPNVFPDAKDWKEFAGYCWGLFGREYPGGVEDFRNGLRRYRATREILHKAGTAFPSAAVAPLDEPLTRVSWIAVNQLLAGPKKQEPEIRLPTADEWQFAATDVWAGAGMKAVGWTGGRARPWPLGALAGEPVAGDTTRGGIRNLVGSVGELVQFEKGVAVMGANYRTDLTADDPLYSLETAVPIRGEVGSEVVGVRFVLAPKPETAPPTGRVKAYRPAADAWADGTDLPTVDAAVFGNRAIEGAQPKDELRFRWHYDRKAIRELIGDHPEWWVAPLRGAVYGFRDELLRDQKPIAAFLPELVNRLNGSLRRE